MNLVYILMMCILASLTYIFYINDCLSLLFILLIIISILPFYFRYEYRKPRAREIVVLAVCVALCVSSRVLFTLTPSFKPMCAVVIICGLAFGSEFGYLCGSLSAITSNIFFGQGGWTPYQMLALALIGYIAGLFMNKEYKNNKLFLLLIGIFSGIFYSLIMDIWTVLSIDQSFNILRYIAIVGTSIPTTVIYCISNVVFLWILCDLLLRKFTRVKIKYDF